MFLDGARLRYEDENGETVVLPAKGRTFLVGSYLTCDLFLEGPQDERLVCEINCDAFGRVSIHNKSSVDPVRLNDRVLHGNGWRPLLHGEKITILGKVYTWEFPKSSAETQDAPGTPERQPLNEPAPNSCPSMKPSHRPQLEKRLTVHNFQYCINSDDEGNTSIELEENVSLNISTPSNAVAEASTCVSPKVNLLEATQNKENTATPPGSHKKLLKLCALSDVVITSFSPRETGVKVEKSFTCVRKPAHAASTSSSVTVSTPKSVYSTPKGGVLSALNEDSCSRDLMDFCTPSTSTKAKRASSMYLIDLTTPSKLRPTPKQTPISVDSTDESSDASPLVIDITNSATPPSPGPSQRYKTPKRPAGNTGATPKRTPQSLMKRALLTSTKKQIAANQTDKTTPVATAKRQSLLEARRQCLSTPRRLPFHPHRRTPIQRPEEHARGKVPKTSPRRRKSLMESPRENKVSQLRKSFAASKRSPGVDKSNKLVAKARRALNSPKSGSPLPGSPKPSSPCPRKTFNVSQIKSSTPEKLDDSKDELSRTFTIMDDTQGKERSAAGAVIEAVAALITGEVEDDVSFQLGSVFKTSPSLNKSKEPILVEHKVEATRPSNEKDIDTNSAEEKMNSKTDDAIFIENESKLENDLETDKDQEETKSPSNASLQDKEQHETLSIPVNEKGEEPIDDSICEEVHANIPKGSDIANPESIIEDNICEEVPSDSKTTGESISIGETKQKMNEQTPNVNTPVLRRSLRRLSVDQKAVATTPRRSTRRSSMEASNKQVLNENNKRSRRASCSAVESQPDVGTPQRKRRLTQEMSTPTRQSKRLLNTPKRELQVDESVGDMGVILEEAGQEDEEKSAIADDENYGNELPADEVDKVDYHGLRDLLKTPKNCSTPRFKGLREMMRTPKIPASPILSNMAKLLETSVGNTPHHKSRSTTVARVEQGKALDGILKTPSARNIMVPNEPASAVLKSRVDSLAATTEYDLNMTNTTLHLDKIFDDVPETSGAHLEDTETEINVTALSTATSADPLGASKLNESVSSEALMSVCHKDHKDHKDPLTSTTYKAALQADLNLSGITDAGSRTTSPNPNEMSGIQLLDQTSDSMFSEALVVSAVDSCDVTVDETKASGQTIQPTDNIEDRSDTDSNVGLTEPLVFSDDEEPEDSEVSPKKSTDFGEPSVAYKLEESADLPENKSAKDTSSINEISLIEVEDTTLEGSTSEANVQGDKDQDEKSLEIKLDISKDEESPAEENNEPPAEELTIIESEIFPLDSTADSSVNSSNVLNCNEEKILPKVDPKPDNLESTNLDDGETKEVLVEKATEKGVSHLDKSVIETSPAEKTTEAETTQAPIEASSSKGESTEIKSDVVPTAQPAIEVHTVAESDQPVIEATLSEELSVENQSDEVHLSKKTNPKEPIEEGTTQSVIETSSAEEVSEKGQPEEVPTDPESNQIAIETSPPKHLSEENIPDEAPTHGETDQEVTQTSPAEELPDKIEESNQPVIETSPSEQLTEENKTNEVPKDSETEQQDIKTASDEEILEEVKPDEVSTDAESNEPVVVTSSPEPLSTENKPDADEVPTAGETDQEVIKADPSQEHSEESKPDEVPTDTKCDQSVIVSKENKPDGEADQKVIETSPAKDLSEETKLNESIDNKPNHAVFETSHAEKPAEEAKTNDHHQTDSKSNESVIETSLSIQQEVIESLEELSEEVKADEVSSKTSSPNQLSEENQPDADEVPTDGKTDQEVIETSPSNEPLGEAKPDEPSNQTVSETSPAARNSTEAYLHDVSTGEEADQLVIETSPAEELPEEPKPDIEKNNDAPTEDTPKSKEPLSSGSPNINQNVGQDKIEPSLAEESPDEAKPDLKKHNDAPSEETPSQADKPLSSGSPNINQNVAQDTIEIVDTGDSAAFDEVSAIDGDQFEDQQTTQIESVIISSDSEDKEELSADSNAAMKETSVELSFNATIEIEDSEDEDPKQDDTPTRQVANVPEQIEDELGVKTVPEADCIAEQSSEKVELKSEKSLPTDTSEASSSEATNESPKVSPHNESSHNEEFSMVHENEVSSMKESSKEVKTADKKDEEVSNENGNVPSLMVQTPLDKTSQETDQNNEVSVLEESSRSSKTKEDTPVDTEKTEECQHIKTSDQEIDDEVIQLDASSIENTLDESSTTDHHKEDSILDKTKEGTTVDEKETSHCRDESSFIEDGETNKPKESSVFEETKEDKELDKEETEKYNHNEPDDEVIQLDASSIVEETPLNESSSIEDSIGDSIQEDSAKQVKDILEEKESFNQNGVEDEVIHENSLIEDFITDHPSNVPLSPESSCLDQTKKTLSTDKNQMDGEKVENDQAAEATLDKSSDNQEVKALDQNISPQTEELPDQQKSLDNNILQESSEKDMSPNTSSVITEFSGPHKLEAEKYKQSKEISIDITSAPPVILNASSSNGSETTAEFEASSSLADKLPIHESANKPEVHLQDVSSAICEEQEAPTKVQDVVKEDISKTSSGANESDLHDDPKSISKSINSSRDEAQIAVQNESIIDLDASNDGKDDEEDVEFISEQEKMIVPSTEEVTKQGEQPAKVEVSEQIDIIDLDDSSSSAQGTETTDVEAPSVTPQEEKEPVVSNISDSKEPRTSVEPVKVDAVQPAPAEESLNAPKNSYIQEILVGPAPTEEKPEVLQDLSASTDDVKPSQTNSEEKPIEESAQNTTKEEIDLQNKNEEQPISETDSPLQSTKMPCEPLIHEKKSPVEGVSTPLKRVTRKGSASSDRPAEAGVSERPKRLARKPSAEVSEIEDRAVDNKQADDAHVKPKSRARKPSADVDDDKQEAITERRRGRKRTPSVEVPETTAQTQLKANEEDPKPEEALQPILEEEPEPTVEEKDSKAEQETNQREITVEKPKRRGRKASAKETEATLNTEERTKHVFEALNEDKSEEPEEPTVSKEETKSGVEEKQDESNQKELTLDKPKRRGRKASAKETDTELEKKEKVEDLLEAVNEDGTQEQKPVEESHTSNKANEKVESEETIIEKPKRRGRKASAKETETSSDQKEKPEEDEAPHSNQDNADHSEEKAPQDALLESKEEQEITAETETSAHPAKSSRRARKASPEDLSNVPDKKHKHEDQQPIEKPDDESKDAGKARDERPKRRGRKPSAEVVETEATVQEGQLDDQNMPQPRARRSAENIPAIVQEPAKDEHIEKPKRRGRKPSVDVDHVAQEVAGKPRRRGRTPAGEEKQEPPLQAAEPEKKTRRNARKASAETVETVVASEDAHLQQIEEAAEPVSESEASPAKPPPKEEEQEEHKTRRRGRKPTAETIEVPLMKTSSPEKSDEIPSHSRRRGRKATEDEAAATVEIAEIPSESQTEAKPTRRGRKPSADVEAPEKKPPARRVRKASANVDEGTPVAKKAATRRGRKEETPADEDKKHIDLQELPAASVSATVITSASPTKTGDAEELTPRRREGRNLPRKNYEEAPDDDKPQSAQRRARKPAASKAVASKAPEPEALIATPVAKPPPVEIEATPENTVVMPEPTTSQRREGRNLPRKNYTEAPDDDKPTSSRGRRVRNLTAKALELIVDSSPRPATPKRPKAKAVEDEEPAAKKATPEIPPPEDELAPAAKGRGTRRKVEHSESEELPVKKNVRAAARKGKVEAELEEHHPPVKKARGGARAKTPVEESAEEEPLKKPAARSRARGAKAAEPEQPAEDVQDQDATTSTSAATGRGGRGRKVHFEAAPEVATTSEDAPKRATRSRRK
ncbi:fap1 adhesin [Drosophila takahashii]|uniref:fap1 adhesin n=1 Tax=Drosophila takahashii TaxID=29030 RepID=UPI001CF8547C|nr:titin [Drosophila takahashii]